MDLLVNKFRVESNSLGAFTRKSTENVPAAVYRIFMPPGIMPVLLIQSLKSNSVEVSPTGRS